MNVFLSYAAEQRDLAERIALELRAQGEIVYFDKDDVREGDAVHSTVREQIERADFFVFLMSPDSLRPGRYPLAELSLAKRRWKNPVDHVLPVLAAHIPSKEWPPYLRTLSALRSHIDIGADPVADVCRVIRRRSRRTRFRHYALAGGAIAALAAIVGVTVYLLRPPPPLPAGIAPEFAIRGDQQNGKWGEAISLSLFETRPGIVSGYRCRVEWNRGVNIRDVNHDRQCKDIEVMLDGGPFAASGNRPSGLMENFGRIAETVRIVVVDSSGREVWQRDATINLLNLVSARNVKLENIGGGLGDPFHVNLGQVYETDVEINGRELAEGFRCTVSEPPSRSFVVLRASVIGEPCRLRLTPAIQRETTSTWPANANLTLTLSHEKRGFSDKLELDFSVHD